MRTTNTGTEEGTREGTTGPVGSRGGEVGLNYGPCWTEDMCVHSRGHGHPFWSTSVLDRSRGSHWWRGPKGCRGRVSRTRVSRRQSPVQTTFLLVWPPPQRRRRPGTLSRDHSTRVHGPRDSPRVQVVPQSFPNFLLYPNDGFRDMKPFSDYPGGR